MNRPAPDARRLPDGTFYVTDEQGKFFLTSVSTLAQAAASGQPYAPTSAYLLGRAYATGEASSNHQPDYSLATHWYSLAMQGGSIRGIYWGGALFAQGKSFYPDPKGVLRPNLAIGQQLMQIALAHGYNPSSDTVNGPSILTKAQTQRDFASMRPDAQPPQSVPAQSPSRPSDPLTAGEIFGGILAVGVAAAILSGGSASSASNNATKSDSTNSGQAAQKSCWVDTSHSVPDSSPSGSHWETSGHTGYGYACW